MDTSTNGKRAGARSVMAMGLLAAIAGMTASAEHYQVRLGRESAPPRLPRDFMFAGGSMPASGGGRRKSPSGAPMGTYWAGDGVKPERETRQMRRARERAAA